MITFLTIWKFLKGVFHFAIDNWKVVVPAIVLIFIVVFVYRSCHKPARLDEAAIQKAQQAIAEHDRDAMVKILAESDVAEKHIDETLANAKTETVNAVAEAKKKANAMTNEELAAELEARSK